MPRSNKNNWKLKKSLVIPVVILALAIIGCGVVLGLILDAYRSLPNWKNIGFETENTSFIYDLNGDQITQLHKSENRTPVELKQMPTYLIDAFITTEDVRFRQHHGVDYKRILGALVADIRNKDYSQGASTITMQLARNAILETQEKTIERKIKEALLAIQIERHYTKDEILNFYLNEIYFGHSANGVQAAAQTYFGKDVQDLTLGESAVLAGLVRNPRIYSPFLNPENSLRVRNVVLDNMIRYEKISAEQADKAKEETLKLTDYKKQSLYAYPWFVDYVIAQAEELLEEADYDPNNLYTGGFNIYTTIDTKVQKAGENAYTNNDLFPKSNSADAVQSAMAVLDPDSGEIRALIGGREYVTKRGFNRATDMKRQPGSSIKPIAVYAPALEMGYTPASIVDDSPAVFGSSANPYCPVNYDGRYRGKITMRKAVQYSVNIPAVKILDEIGISKGFDFAINLGLPLDETNDKNLSLALGGLTKGVSPLNMAAAYAAFDNSGVYVEPHAIIKITDQQGNTIIEPAPKKHIAMTEKTAYLMTDMLKTAVDAGTGTKAKMNRPVAGKTGTTQLPDKEGFKNIKGNKDAWFAGYTPELVGVVWMGYDDDYDDNGNPQYLSKVYGGQYPAMIWKSVMTESLRNVPVKPFHRPKGIPPAADIKTENIPEGSTPDNSTKNETIELVAVCTDPRHGDKLYLANVPKPGESGGCPQSCTVFMNLEPEKIPSSYCDLQDHLIESKKQ